MELTSNIEKVDSDSSDIVLAKKGDKDAFIRMIQSNKQSLYRVAVSFLSDSHDVEDAIQASIIKAYEGIGKLRKDEYFKTWIIRIVINQCKDILKKNKRLISIEEVSIDEGFTDDLTKLEIISAIKQLDSDLRIVTTLFYFEDMAQKDIAKILSIPEGTVRSRLSRARSKLYELLK
ncbi:RNA polymerase sigma factor [Clostridium manihotivorum]|uniref:RNA polymerase subunit sigma-24 n=1 Tax=Clostridium manihotivorum TaxID=2320868 RepID=A0A3R5QV22_9CLOT|nr:sigma-70 family RNA polymerase sigma factor [Clostridium manihotivorum]QAA33310.1 RNA polymerase subunit sigma-24 [Clostridium manihotivorum]